MQSTGERSSGGAAGLLVDPKVNDCHREGLGPVVHRERGRDRGKGIGRRRDHQQLVATATQSWHDARPHNRRFATTGRAHDGDELLLLDGDGDGGDDLLATYEAVVRRYPASSYSDNALWQAAHLAIDAYARFGDQKTIGTRCTASCAPPWSP